MSLKLSHLQCITLTAMLAAIIVILTFTPFAFPQIPLIGSATVMHIPVIIGAVLMGPKYGALLGFLFGLSSMYTASTTSIALNRFAFSPFVNVPGTESGSLWAVVIAFGPRILVGVVAALTFMGIMKFASKKLMPLALAIAAGVASMTNTLLVVNLLYFLFREPWTYARAYAGNEAPQITYTFIVGIITSLGVAEAIVAILIVPAVCVAIFAVAKKMPRKP